MLLGSFDGLLDLKSFTRMNDIDNCAGPRRFKVLQKRPSMPSVGIRRVYALCREVVQLFKVRVPVRSVETGLVRFFFKSQLSLKGWVMGLGELGSKWTWTYITISFS